MNATSCANLPCAENDARFMHRSGLAADLIVALTSSKISGTVVLALSEPIAIDRFDRVIELRDGVISFDGPAVRWTRDDESHCHAHQTTESTR